MNPGLSPAVQEAFARRQQGAPTPAMGQVSPGAAMANPVPQPMPQSQLTQASAPQGAPTGEALKAPKFEPQDRTDLITLALIEQMKNDSKLEKEKTKMAESQPSPQPSQPPVGGGSPIGGFSLSPGFTQPMAVNQMQGNYQNGMGKDYSGMNNYGKGTF